MITLKHLLIASAVAIALFASAWLFNHINPYAGIILALATLVILYNYIQRQFRKR